MIWNIEMEVPYCPELSLTIVMSDHWPSLPQSARFDQFQNPKNCGTLVGAIRNRIIIMVDLQQVLRRADWWYEKGGEEK